MIDLVLAMLHHGLMFGLAIMLAVQFALVRDGMSGADGARVARLDIGYGASSGLIVIIGILRVIYGLKGYEYYLVNVWFWAKMATFALIGLLSIAPTIRFRAWRTSFKANPAFTPTAAEIGTVRTALKWELRLLIVVVAFAATMARYTSF